MYSMASELSCDEMTSLKEARVIEFLNGSKRNIERMAMIFFMFAK